MTDHRDRICQPPVSARVTILEAEVEALRRRVLEQDAEIARLRGISPSAPVAGQDD